jgi:hypothetical protein
LASYRDDVGERSVIEQLHLRLAAAFEALADLALERREELSITALS